MVDDDPLLLPSLAAWLTRRGFEIVPVASGPELAKLCEQGGDRDWSCALVDLSVTASSGVPAYRYLRSRFPDLPILLMSGGDMTHVAQEVLAEERWGCDRQAVHPPPNWWNASRSL